MVGILLLVFWGTTVYASDLEYIKLPYYKATYADLNKVELQKLIQTVLPGATDVWYDRNDSGLVIAGYIYLNKAAVEGISKKAFLKEIQAIGDGYVKMYKRDKPGAVTTYKIQEDGPIVELIVKSKFFELGAYSIDYRNLFFYNPNYRVDVVTTFLEKDTNVVYPVIQKSLNNFKATIKQKYPQGINFKGR